MGTFVEDTFTDTNGVAITSHTGETGATWTRNSTMSTNSGAPTIQSNKCQVPFEVQWFYYTASATPASADYTVEAVFTLNAAERGGLIVRASGGDAYHAYWEDASHTLSIAKRVSNAFTDSIGSPASVGFNPVGAGKLKLSVSGTTITVSAQRMSDSMWLKSDGSYQSTELVAITLTGDSSITAAGKPGFWFLPISGQPTVDSFIATEAGAALVQYYPTVDISAGGWTTSTGSGTLASHIDETSASDTDYIQSPVNPTAAAFEVQFGTLATPSANTNHTISYRFKVDGAQDMEVKLIAGDGSTVIKTWTHSPGPTSYTTYDQTDLTGGDIAAWLAAGYAGSRLRGTAA